MTRDDGVTTGANQGQPLRWGIVGTGTIADAFVADLALTDSGQAVAVGSRHLASARQFADRHSIPRRHAGYEALAGDPDVEAVYVATPHPMHHPNTLMALRAGKAVLVEKAFAMNAIEAAEMVGTARRQGVFLMEAMWTRFLPHMIRIRELLAERVLGEIVTVTADFGRWFAADPGSRLFDPALGGGALLDLGVYPVSFASMVLGPPTRVLSLVSPAFTGVDAQTSVVLGYAGSAQSVLTCTSLATSDTRAAIVGTQARIDIDGEFYRPTAFTLTTRAGKRTRFEVPHQGHGLRHEADEVARCLREGLLESPVMPLDESVSIMQTMDLALGSAAPP